MTMGDTGITPLRRGGSTSQGNADKQEIYYSTVRRLVYGTSIKGLLIQK